jgi:hypothetical protein
MTASPKAIDRIPAPVPDVKVEVIDGELLLYHPAKPRRSI